MEKRKNIDVLIVGTGELSNTKFDLFDRFPKGFVKIDASNDFQFDTSVIDLLREKLENPAFSVINNTLFEELYTDCYVDSFINKGDYLKLLEWVQMYDSKEKVIFFDEEDEEFETPFISAEEIPQRFHSVFESASESTDLSAIHNRKALFNLIKSLHPETKIINYTTLDMYMLQPNRDNYLEENVIVGGELGISAINLKEHITCNFLDFIKTASKKYDVIYFFGCTHPSYVLENDLLFKENLSKCLSKDGKLIYSDGWDYKDDEQGLSFQDKTDIFGFVECSKFIDDRVDFVSSVVKDCFNKVSVTPAFFYYTVK
jgi:hypothetical protein